MSETEKLTTYLSYLAEAGATNIHPLAQRGTDCLIDALDPRQVELLLEIGCGTAETMVRLILQAGVSADGVDILLPMLKVAQRRLSLTGTSARAHLALACGTALPAATGRYDGVYTESVLGYQSAEVARRMLSEIRRVLRPGGRYVANEATWKKGTAPATISAIHDATVADFGSSPASPQPWTSDDWTRVMRETGFLVQRADLLAECVALTTKTDTTSRPWQMRLSAMLTAFYRLRSFFTPRLLCQKWQYRRRLARHAEDARHLESRLFVLVAR